jgi:hypothetical protein
LVVHDDLFVDEQESDLWLPSQRLQQDLKGLAAQPGDLGMAGRIEGGVGQGHGQETDELRAQGNFLWGGGFVH